MRSLTDQGTEDQGTEDRYAPLRVLVVSATVGAGDAGNARELARRLAGDGHEVTVRDFLEAPPLAIGRIISKGYEAELRHAPWAYELVFRIWFWFPFLLVPLTHLLSLFTRRSVSRWARQARADVVVSTYSVATLVVGDMRRRAKKRWRRRCCLAVPAVNFVTDFGYHPFWAHPHIDVNLAVHPDTAAAVARRTGRPSMACGPLVNPDLAAAPARRALARHQLGLEPGDLAVLVSSGSWGIGAVAETLKVVAGQPGLVPVVACGRNDDLRRDLERLVEGTGHRAVVLGWTDDMAGVMAACDVLVENAGGLTSFEAMRVGVPLVSFRPIPGHGRNSVAAMSAAGVTCIARTGAELADHLQRLARPGAARDAQLAAAARLFCADAADVVADVATIGPPPSPRLRPAARVTRAVAGASMAAAIAWVGLTTGVGVAAAAGIGVAQPPASAARTAFLGVRMGLGEIASPAIQSVLAGLHASAVVDLRTADLDPGAVRSLARHGIDVESGGLGGPPSANSATLAPWSLALSDSKSVHDLSAVAGRRVSALVPDRALSAFDLVDAGSDHLMVVVPDATLPAAPEGPFPREELRIPRLHADQIYVVNGLRLTPDQLVVLLASLRSQLAREHLASAPLCDLK